MQLFSTRRAALFGAAALALAGAMPAAAQPGRFTPQECSLISVTTERFIGAAPNVSDAFVDSITRFLAPNGTADCSGDGNIATPTRIDIAVFQSIGGTLAGGQRPIFLDERGVRAVASIGPGRPGQAGARRVGYQPAR